MNGCPECKALDEVHAAVFERFRAAGHLPRLPDMATPERSVLFSERGGGLSPATVRLWFHRLGSVSKVEMVTPMALIYKALFSSISTFETPPLFEEGDASGLGIFSSTPGVHHGRFQCAHPVARLPA